MSRFTKPSLRLPYRRAVAVTAAFAAAVALGGATSAAASTRPAARTVPAASAARTAAKITPADRDGDHGEVPEAGVCSTCKPPLAYSSASGPVMGAANGTITLTPIYWTPTGYSFDSADPTYRTLINKYISDIAADSGTAKNVYSILPEYYQTANGVTTNIKYKFVAGTPMVDTDPFPTTGQCTNTAPPAGLGIVYTACITDAQTQAELKAYTAANSLPNDLSHLYLLFFPPNAQTSLGTTNFSLTQFAGYHSHIGTLIYGNEPFDPGFAVAAPNDDPSADSAINTISHEVSEAITDPNGGSGWGDTANPGNEIGDECAGNYGAALGTVSTPDYGAQAYNQVINGDKYYTQTEFSNGAYKATGVGTGCRQTAVGSGGNVVRHGTRHDTAGVTSMVTVDTSPSTIPADGTSTTTVTATATDSNGDPVAGDPIVLATRDDIATPGSCGTLSTGFGPTAAQTTNAAGQVTATYTAATSTADCYVTATDTSVGTTNQTIIYQGDASTAPDVTQTTPATLTSGGNTETFTVSAMNPSADNIPDARFDLYLTGDDNGSAGLDASQLTLSYKDTETNGNFVNIPLTGSTANGGVINGFIVPDTTAALDAGATKTATFQLTLAGNAADTATTGSPLQIQTDLDQFDPADGSQSNLIHGTPTTTQVVQAPGDTITYNGKLVTTAAPSGSTPGTAVLVAKTCTFTSDNAPCRLTGTETFTAVGGTLTGTITTEPKPGRPDQTITYTETFTTSPGGGTGTGTAQVVDFDNGNSFTANLADTYQTSPDKSAPNVQGYQGTLTLTNPTP